MATLQDITSIVDSARNSAKLYSSGSPYISAQDVANNQAAFNALTPQEISTYVNTWGEGGLPVIANPTAPTPQQTAAVAAAIAAEKATSGQSGTNLGGTGTAKVADTGTVIDNTKLNTQGGGSALSTGDINKIATTGGSALSTGDINKIATTGGSALSTGSIPALTTGDLTNWYNTQPKGITADQLNSALNTQQASSSKAYADALQANQTALTAQNTEFLKNWNSSADALKTNILSGVDTKNQAFGTQATQGFMDAFKNFQIPTNQQTGVNLGNYNDNRNAAADQWWSQYVTGRR